jgi:hypothetical protein
VLAGRLPSCAHLCGGSSCHVRQRRGSHHLCRLRSMLTCCPLPWCPPCCNSPTSLGLSPHLGQSVRKHCSSVQSGWPRFTRPRSRRICCSTTSLCLWPPPERTRSPLRPSLLCMSRCVELYHPGKQERTAASAGRMPGRAVHMRLSPPAVLAQPLARLVRGYIASPPSPHYSLSGDSHRPRREVPA